MSSLFYYITSDRYDKEDGPHDCQIVRFFEDEAHWQEWMADPLNACPVDMFECEGGRVADATHQRLTLTAAPGDLIKNYLTTMNAAMAKLPNNLPKEGTVLYECDKYGVKKERQND